MAARPPLPVFEVCERVWRGVHHLRRLGIDPDLRDVKIILSVDLHAHCMKDLANGVAPVSVVRDYSLPGGLRIFGVPAERDSNLEDGEIRFRSEVSV